MRYNVYIQQPYPIGMSDIRMLDSRISTVWCQKQIVWSNATYNAYLLSEKPELLAETKHVSMTRHLVLDDDMKEYWGFYLLKGSTVSVSTCVRWPGASLIMIRGHRHLKQCAYIGDNSSEELEELEEADVGNNTSNEPSNKPHEMKKIMEGVVVHTGKNKTEYPKYGSSDISGYQISKMKSLGKTWKLDKKPAHVHLMYADQITNPRRKQKKESDYYNLHSESVNIPVSVEKKAQTSKELYEELLKKLNGMGVKSKSILAKLNKELDEKGTGGNENTNVFQEIHKSTNNEEMKNENPVNSFTQEDKERKRDIKLGTQLHSELTRHDENNDHAMEEGLHKPDGISEIHGTINETNLHDKSNSEFWSSFSSSEERLLQCEGLLLNLPLTPHPNCDASRPDYQLATAATPNSMTYTIPSNGYYFFVFNSENEVQSNFIRVHFRLEKTTYNVSHPLAACRNKTGPCSLPLHFWSNDKVVLELPVRSNDSLWNQEFLAVSTCEPRTAIYVGCVIAVPLLIILFAFQ